MAERRPDHPERNGYARKNGVERGAERRRRFPNGAPQPLGNLEPKLSPISIPQNGGGRFGELSGLIGSPAALLLVETYGGRRIYVPDRVADHHPLVDLIGKPAAEALSGAHGPGWITVPVSSAMQADLRKGQIVRMLRAGHEVRDIANELGVSERLVKRHRARLKAEGRL